MAVSLETRAPFLDHKVVEFAYHLPTQYKIDHKVQKKILKDMLYKYVDRTLIDRPKQGFSLPMKRWLRVELKDWAYDRLKSLPSDKFNGSAIEKIWYEHQNGLKDNSEKIWGLCNLANFLVKK
ncbi:MAG: asparagine synthase (glutamine-hydrolyzing) [Pantoea stewartii]|nr:MAG: asparagine synthase (glutamine-hydrolyzing) [Pantoea stewartii]